MIPRLHIVTDDATLRKDAFLHDARTVLEAGGPELALHLRGPRTEGRRIFDLADALLPPAQESGAVLLVNDRVDVALCLGLSGVHLGQRSLPPAVARPLLGADRLLGLSVHGAPEVRSGLSGELDYLVVGTIFPSESHPDGTPGGMERIQAVAAVSGLPLLAIGGLTPGRVVKVLEAGAHGVAVRGAIWDAPDKQWAVEAMVEALEEGCQQEEGEGREG